MSKPRVFVSSTYYDLKYVRERIENFIHAYCMEPILFESDDVFFHPNSSLDESCYNEIKHCHMMLLVVGGRYGSMASEQKEKYEEKYVSITQREYETARQKNIPVMVFVEQNVYAEYKTYLANTDNNADKLKYAFVDDIRVFKFISKLDQGAIKVFGKVDDIEHYFSHQISGMLLDYLTALQSNKTENDIKSAVSQLEGMTKTMQRAVNQIAEKVLEDDKGKYEALLQAQKQSQIDLFLQLFKQSVDWGNAYEIGVSEDKINTISSIFESLLFNWNAISANRDTSSYRSFLESCKWQCEQSLLSQYNYKNVRIYVQRFGEQLKHIADIVINDTNLQYYFRSKLPIIIKEIAEASWLM